MLAQDESLRARGSGGEPVKARRPDVLASLEHLRRPVIVGREPELAAIGRFVDTIAAGPSALVIEGEAGIGKTTLWAHGVGSARDRVCWLLSSRAVEAEIKLAFTALGDLLDQVPQTVLGELPAPQREAIEVALLRKAAASRRLDERIIGVALLGVFRSLAGIAPVVIAIDDLHWLDVPSARALSFALRRLNGEPVAVIATIRVEETPAALDIKHAHVQRLAVGPLEERTLVPLLTHHLEVQYSRQLVRRLHALSCGNPLYALELARAVPPDRALAADDELHLPESLAEAMRARLDKLSPAAAQAVLVASALSKPTSALIGAALGSQSAASAIEEANAAEIVAVEDTQVRFTHPLLGFTAYSSITQSDRRRLHAMLAKVVEDVEERAKHLALAAEGPDEAIASVLDEAAKKTLARGAAFDAATLLEHAFRLTPAGDGDTKSRRAKEGGQLYIAAGDATGRGETLLKAAIRVAESASVRAWALASLSQSGLEDERRRIELLEQARADAGDDVFLIASIERQLAACWEAFDLRRARHHARRGLTFAERAKNHTLIASALTFAALYDFQYARGTPFDMLERAVELEPAGPEPMIFVRPRVILGYVLGAADDLDRARTVLQEALAQAQALGTERTLPTMLVFLADVDSKAGRFDLASRHLEDALARARELNASGPFRLALSRAAVVDAFAGRVEAARERATEVLGLAERAGLAEFASTWIQPRWTLGFLELSRGDAASAWEHLRPLGHAGAAQGLQDPSCFAFVPDQIEALVGIGDVDQARGLLVEHVRRARKVDRALALATAERCHALIRAAEGDVAGALEACQEAIAQHDRIDIPFELGRTLIVKGMLERRARRRGAARESLEQAVETFECVGTPLWAEKARTELLRARPRSRSGAELTPTEERIALLVAAGRSNPEIAKEIFVSRKTVEAHLHRIFGKLGIRSRTELAAKVAAERSMNARAGASKT